MKKRIIALLLVLATMLSLMGSAAPTMIGESAVSESAVDAASYDYSAYIEKKAQFDLTYSNFPVVSDPTTIIAKNVFNTVNLIFAEDIPADLVVVIRDCYVNDAEGLYWYLVEAAEGHTLPDVFPAEAWVFQNFVGSVGGESLIILPDEPETTCPICGEVNCDKEHVFCDICGKYDCGMNHAQCPICGELGCDGDHVYCSVCGKYDCGVDHNVSKPPMTAPVIPAYTLPEDMDSAIVDGNGTVAPATGFVLAAGKQMSLSAWTHLENASYKWQIRYDHENDLWTDIQGKTGKGILFSAAMLLSTLNEYNMAYLRFVASNGTEEITSDAVAITVRNYTSVSSGGSDTEAVAVDLPEAQAEEDVPELKSYSVVINYVFANNETAADPYTATLAAGSNFSATVTHPTIMGYLPYIGNATDTSTQVNVNVTDIQANVTYTITYKPTNVNYTVIYRQQNVKDDNYTIVKTETKQGLTGSVVPKVTEDYPGFYALLYERPAIAADGSTVVQVDYDRYYYLVKFDLSGGYGVEPVYARYGADLAVGTPTRPGYVFDGWSLDGVTEVDLPSTVPAKNETYIALWTPGDPVKYTVVYWKENANDNNYSYWTQRNPTAVPGTVVSGSNNVAQYVNDEQYFTYNDILTDKNVVVEGDGSTVVNVYYNRNYYTLIFYYDGECNIPEHTHSANCEREKICMDGGHTHNANCDRTLVCTLEEHKHHEGCNLLCGLPVHAEHTDVCLQCTKELHPAHTVNDGCYTLNCKHTHTVDCYYVNNRTLITASKPTQLANNLPDGIHTYSQNRQTYYYLKIGNTWYCSSNKNNKGTEPTNVISERCTHAHSMDNGCYDFVCTKPIHEAHSEKDGCYSDVIHTQHTDDCYDHSSHEHTVPCYVYRCGEDNHTHTDACYRACTLYAHTHGNSCRYSNNNDQEIFRVITAKYEQNISDQWPTADDISGFAYWTGNGLVSGGQSSKVHTMTGNLCYAGGNKLEAHTNTTKYTLNYWFEHFDQTVKADGVTYKEYEGKLYKLSTEYSQTTYYRSGQDSWGYKDITGLTPAEDDESASRETGNVFNLFYDRNRWDLNFQNVKDVVKSETDIMFEQRLVNYKDGNGNLLSSFVPNYPSASYEEGTRRFEGWYTTPECFEGTKVNWETFTMPNDDVTLYANWVPVTRTVRFFLDKADMEAGKIIPDKMDELYAEAHGGAVNADSPYDKFATKTVPNNSYLSNISVPGVSDGYENHPYKSYTFIGWFYMDEGQEKAFDPENMPVTQDLNLYAKWSSNVLKEYSVFFKLDGTNTEIADSIIGSALAGTTKSFDAKGGLDLYADYRVGYFPLVKSHSLTLNIDDESQNTFTFWYVQKDAVPYSVYYVTDQQNDAGNLPEIQLDGKTYYIVADTNTNSENRKAVVTEKFVPVQGYMPDAYQKRLVVDGTDDAVNKIIFFYTKDTQHAYYKITHYTQNTDGETWAEYASSEVVGDIGKTYSADPLTIDGFTYDSTVAGTVVSGVLTADGLELKLYYTRNSYPYEVRYLEQGTGKQLADPKSGSECSELYGKVISENAIDIANYTAVAPTSQTLTVKIEESQTEAKLNIITFYYVENTATINYVVVGPEGCGTVNPESETVKVLNGVAKGSTATATENFRFVGWFSDDACTKKIGENGTYVPAKSTDTWTDATYYAKFEPALADLTITKTVAQDIDENQSFIFDVTGPNGFVMTVVINGNSSVTIKDLPIAKYTVTERTNWSWRYTPKDAKIEKTLIADSAQNVVVFENTRSDIFWLSGDSFNENQFKLK